MKPHVYILLLDLSSVDDEHEKLRRKRFFSP